MESTTFFFKSTSTGETGFCKNVVVEKLRFPKLEKHLCVNFAEAGLVLSRFQVLFLSALANCNFWSFCGGQEGQNPQTHNHFWHIGEWVVTKTPASEHTLV